MGRIGIAFWQEPVGFKIGSPDYMSAIRRLLLKPLFWKIGPILRVNHSGRRQESFSFISIRMMELSTYWL